MKMKHLAMATLATLGFASCSNNDVDSSIEATTPKGNAYASFTINLGSSSSTRAAGDGTEAGEANEQAITKVRAVMYANNLVAYAFDYQITGTGAAAPAGDGIATTPSRPNSTERFTTKAEAVEKKNYEVALIVNPTQKLIDATNKGNTLQDLMNAADQETIASLQAQGFLMTNEQGLIQLRADQLQADDKAAEANPIPVKVDRALAKVIVSKNQPEATGATVAIKDWTLDITNKKMFYLRKLNQLAGYGTFDGGAMETPNDGSDRKDRYAIDPNYQELGNLTNKTYDEKLELLKPEFNIYDKEVFDSEKTLAGGSEYALENTIAHGKEHAVKSQATRVILRATYKPDAVSAAEDWYSYAGMPMTAAEFKAKYTEALMADWNQLIDGVVPSFTNEIKNIVFFSAYITKALNKNGVGLTPDEKVYFEENETSLKPKYARLVVVDFTPEALAGIDTAISNATAVAGKIKNVKLTDDVIEGITFKDKAFAVGDLKFYKGGDNYYFLYVKHFNHADQAPTLHQYGRYGLVRNNVYKVNVTKLLRPGEPTITPPVTGEPTIPTEPVDPENPKPTEPDPTDPDNPMVPEEPIDGQELYVAYEVEILPWYIREQDYEVK